VLFETTEAAVAELARQHQWQAHRQQHEWLAEDARCEQTHHATDVFKFNSSAGALVSSAEIARARDGRGHPGVAAIGERAETRPAAVSIYGYTAGVCAHRVSEHTRRGF